MNKSTKHMIKINELSYRELQENEISLLIDYRVMFLKELQGEQLPKSEQELRESLKEYFNYSFKSKTFVGIVAEYHNQPVGFGGMVIQQIPGNFNLINGLEGYILSMYTLPEYRKNGIAKEILDRLVKRGKDDGLGKIYLHASEKGIHLYRQYGFKEPELPMLVL